MTVTWTVNINAPIQIAVNAVMKVRFKISNKLLVIIARLTAVQIH